jgi:hypothetical protein
MCKKPQKSYNPSPTKEGYSPIPHGWDCVVPVFAGWCPHHPAKKKPLQLNAKAFSKNTAATYSPTLLCSTIGHEGLNFSVRNGKR